MLNLRGRSLASGHYSGTIVLVSESGIPVADCGEHPVFGVRAGMQKAFADRLKSGQVPGCAVLIFCDDPLEGISDMLSSAEIPAVCGLRSSFFENGDRVVVEGDLGNVTLSDVTGRRVVNCIVKSGEKFLLLKRSDRVGSFQGKWAAVSGYVEEGESPEITAYRELKEEISLSEPLLLKKGDPVVTRKGTTAWISYPFLFDVHGGKEDISLDWEHTEYRWVLPQEMGEFETVPGLLGSLHSLGISGRAK